LTNKSAGHAITVIEHDHENYGITSIPGQSDGCFEAGCYKDEIYYDLDMDQIKSLIDISG